MANYENQLITMIKNDDSMIEVLRAVEKLKLNDAWVCAGFIRNKVWDVLDQVNTPLNDIDVIYFDPSNPSIEEEKHLEAKLENLLPNHPWSVKNQVRMHSVSGFKPFASSYDAVAHFPETPTAIAARMVKEEVEIMAPYGLQDLFKMRVRATPYFKENATLYAVYVERIRMKKWEDIWENISIEF